MTMYKEVNHLPLTSEQLTGTVEFGSCDPGIILTSSSQLYELSATSKAWNYRLNPVRIDIKKDSNQRGANNATSSSDHTAGEILACELLPCLGDDSEENEMRMCVAVGTGETEGAQRSVLLVYAFSSSSPLHLLQTINLPHTPFAMTHAYVWQAPYQENISKLSLDISGSVVPPTLTPASSNGGLSAIELRSESGHSLGTSMHSTGSFMRGIVGKESSTDIAGQGSEVLQLKSPTESKDGKRVALLVCCPERRVRVYVQQLNGLFTEEHADDNDCSEVYFPELFRSPPSCSTILVVDTMWGSFGGGRRVTAAGYLDGTILITVHPFDNNSSGTEERSESFVVDGPIAAVQVLDNGDDNNGRVLTMATSVLGTLSWAYLYENDSFSILQETIPGLDSGDAILCVRRGDFAGDGTDCIAFGTFYGRLLIVRVAADIAHKARPQERLKYQQRQQPGDLSLLPVDLSVEVAGKLTTPPPSPPSNTGDVNADACNNPAEDDHCVLELVWSRYFPHPVHAISYQDYDRDCIKELVVITSHGVHILHPTEPWGTQSAVNKLGAVCKELSSLSALWREAVQ